ncbi:MAG: galactose ABC transporter substrate-binding protein [Ruminococcaceae bacterium]|nr:galactose ABC transporter substrate-binding protein [Oscillospiraceae bacterium]
MKKLIALLLALVMVFALVACAADEVVEETPEEEEVVEEVEEEVEEEVAEAVDVVAGVFWYDFSDAFLSTVRDALDAELTAAGINFTNYDAASTQATQNDQIDTAISQGANLLIVNVVDTAAVDAAQAIVDKAAAAEIPVIFFNREVDDAVLASYEEACFVGTRAAEAGEMQGQMAGEYIRDNYDAIDLNGDGTISYIMMKGELGNPEAEARTQFGVEFCNAVLVEAGKPELAYYDANNADKFQPSNWSKTTAFELMETALSTNPMDGDAPIEVVFANNDDAALGCVEALNNAGWNTGEGDTIPVFGVDYTADAAAAIDAGKMAGSILQSATGMAETVAALAANVQAGKAVFADAEANFNVDEGTTKIRVPYEIKG